MTEKAKSLLKQKLLVRTTWRDEPSASWEMMMPQELLNNLFYDYLGDVPVLRSVFQLPDNREAPFQAPIYQEWMKGTGTVIPLVLKMDEESVLLIRKSKEFTTVRESPKKDFLESVFRAYAL